MGKIAYRGVNTVIQTISRRIAQKLGNILNSKENDIEIYSYSMEILILLLMTMALVTVLAVLLGVLKTTLVFLAAFAPFRCFGGGTHLSSGKRCVLVSTVIFITFGYLSYIAISQHILTILVIITILVGLYITIRWVPAGTAKHPITDNRIRCIQKVNMVVALIIYAAAALILIKAGNLSNTFALTLGAMASLVLITPLGYSLIGAIDNSFDIVKRRWQSSV